MYPYFFIFGIYIKSYNVFVLLAGILVIVGSTWLAQKRGLPKWLALIILISMAISTIIGARALHVITNLPSYLKNPELIYNFSFQGQSIFGGIILAIAVGFILSKIFRLDYWRLGDSVAPFLGFGLAVIRIGCYLNGCCYGIITDKPWGVTFPIFSQAHRQQLTENISSLFSSHPVHPTEIYELMVGLFIAGISAYMLKKKLPSGITILTVGILYSVFRFFIQPLRAPAIAQSVPVYFYPLLYIFFIALLSCLLFFRLKYLSKKNRG